MKQKNTILMNENKILELKEGLKANFEKLSDFEYILENNLITSIRLKKDDTESLKINMFVDFTQKLNMELKNKKVILSDTELKQVLT